MQLLQQLYHSKTQQLIEQKLNELELLEQTFRQEQQELLQRQQQQEWHQQC